MNKPNSFPLDALADFLFEAGMLRKTPRTGYQFLGSGAENVAEHSYRVAMVGYVLAKMAGADAGRTVMLCLVHDFHEARTGDFNYVNSIYNQSRQRDAMRDAVARTGLADDLLQLWDEQEDGQTPEAALAHDADQIDLILNLVEQRQLGNPQADAWLQSALQRLITPEGRKLAEAVEKGDPAAWWRNGPDAEWWVNRGKK